MDNLIRLQRDRKSVGHFFFTRGELGQLLSLYSSRVAAGEWRDYALDQLEDMSVVEEDNAQAANPTDGGQSAEL